MFWNLFMSSGPIGRGKGEIASDKVVPDSEEIMPRFEVVYRESFEVDSPEEAVKEFLKLLSQALNEEGNLEFRVMKWTTKREAPNSKARFFLVQSKDVI